MRPSHFSQTNVALSMLGFLGLYLLWYSPMPTISQHSDRYNNRRAHLSVLCKQSQKSFLFIPIPVITLVLFVEVLDGAQPSNTKLILRLSY